MVTPRCPFCNTAGLNNVEAVPFGPALLIFCKNCGAIHGVVANPKSAPVGAADTPGQRQMSADSGPKPEPVKVQPGKMTPERMAAMALLLNRGSTNYRIIRPLTDEDLQDDNQP